MAADRGGEITLHPLNSDGPKSGLISKNNGPYKIIHKDFREIALATLSDKGFRVVIDRQLEPAACSRMHSHALACTGPERWESPWPLHYGVGLRQGRGTRGNSYTNSFHVGGVLSDTHS